MGGQLFKGLNRRYQRDEYETLVQELTPVFEKYLPRFNPCPYLNDKESFGDMDVVVSGDCDYDGLFKELGDVPVHRNGPYTSFLYKEFQVDLIKVAPEEYQFACFNSF